MEGGIPHIPKLRNWSLNTNCNLVLPRTQNHHHHVVPSVWISLTLSCHPLPIFHCLRQVLRATPRIHTQLLYVGSSWSPCFCSAIRRSTSLMSPSLLLQQCSACLVRLTLIVFVMGGRCPYSCCLMGCCLQDLFNIAAAFLCSCRQTLSPSVSLASM